MQYSNYDHYLRLPLVIENMLTSKLAAITGADMVTARCNMRLLCNGLKGVMQSVQILLRLCLTPMSD